MMEDIKVNEFVYKSFKEISYDSANKEYLVNSKKKAVDFDYFVKCLEHSYYKSVDAIYETDAYTHLIEFKNTNIDVPGKQLSIATKYKDTLVLLKSRQVQITGLKMVLVISERKNTNYRKRQRQTLFMYKNYLYYYVKGVANLGYNDVLKIPFRIMTSKEFDNYYKGVVS